MPKKRKPLSKFLKQYYQLIELNEDNEIWKTLSIGEIPIYEISNHGRIRRIDNGMTINPFHSYRKDGNNNKNESRPTYLRVQIYYYENGKRTKKHFEISRLVALNFIPIPKKYLKKGYDVDTLQVNHKNGCLYNNFVENLEWCTASENVQHSHDNGLCHVHRGEEHFSTFLTLEDVVYICNAIELGVKVRECYDKFDLKDKVNYKRFRSCYYSIKYKKSWIHVSQHYNF